ncbi:hypothetical protein BGAL_0150g00030 [Botrytis galanthina]|uniref:Uncharacterized protein n=1 Tax=Botrytis galanthina TaxID=278940 RepID=A0A4S8R850_9HELO|nr:hypothetical protein BGAL_0150g00030 [Botrytis galanthina]
MTINGRNLQMTYNQLVDDRSALDQSLTLLPRLKRFQGYRIEKLLKSWKKLRCEERTTICKQDNHGPTPQVRNRLIT